MKRTALKESPKKALSAWERRRLYSSQLREKTLLQTPGPGTSQLKRCGTVARTTPTLKKSPGGSGAVSAKGPVKSAAARAALSAVRSPQALKKSPKSTRPGAQPFTAKKHSPKQAVTRVHVPAVPAAVKTETFYKKATLASKKPLPTATGLKTSMPTKPSQPALKKVHVGRKSLGRKSLGKSTLASKANKQSSSPTKSPKVAGRSPKSAQETKASTTGVKLLKQPAPQKVKAARVTVAKTTLSRRSMGKRHPTGSAKVAKHSPAGKTGDKTTPSKLISGSLSSPARTSSVTKAKSQPSGSPKRSPTARSSVGKVQASPRKLSTSPKSPRSPARSGGSLPKRATPGSSKRNSKAGVSPTRSPVTGAKRLPSQSPAKSKIARRSADARTPSSTRGEKAQGSSKRASRADSKTPKKATPTSSPVARRSSQSPAKSKVARRSTAGSTLSTTQKKPQASSRKHSASPASPQRVSRGGGKPQKQATPTSAKRDSKPGQGSAKSKVGRPPSAGRPSSTVRDGEVDRSPTRTPRRDSPAQRSPTLRATGASPNKTSPALGVKRQASQSPAKSKIARQSSAGKATSPAARSTSQSSPRRVSKSDAKAQEKATPGSPRQGRKAHPSPKRTSSVTKGRPSQSPVQSKSARRRTDGRYTKVAKKMSTPSSSKLDTKADPSPAISAKTWPSSSSPKSKTGRLSTSQGSKSPGKEKKAEKRPRGRPRSLSKSPSLSPATQSTPKPRGRPKGVSKSPSLSPPKSKTGRRSTSQGSQSPGKEMKAEKKPRGRPKSKSPSSSSPKSRTGRRSASQGSPSPDKEKKSEKRPRGRPKSSSKSPSLSPAARSTPKPRGRPKGGSKSPRRATPSTSKQDSKGHSSPKKTSPFTSAKRQPSQSPPKSKTLRHSTVGKSPKTGEGEKARASSRSPQKALKHASKARSTPAKISPVSSAKTQPSPSPTTSKVLKRSLEAKSPSPAKRMKTEASPKRLSAGDGKAPGKATPSASPLTAAKMRLSRGSAKSKVGRPSLAAKSPSPSKGKKAQTSPRRLSKAGSKSPQRATPGSSKRTPPLTSTKTRLSQSPKSSSPKRASKGRAQQQTGQGSPKRKGEALLSPAKRSPGSSVSPAKAKAGRPSLTAKSPSPTKKLNAQASPQRLSKGGSKSPRKTTPSRPKRGSKARFSPTKISPAKAQPSQSPTKPKVGRPAKSPSPAKRMKAEASPTRLSRSDDSVQELATTPSSPKRGRPSKSPTKSKTPQHSAPGKTPRTAKGKKAKASPTRLSKGDALKKATPSPPKHDKRTRTSPPKKSPIKSAKGRRSSHGLTKTAGGSTLGRSESTSRDVKAEASPQRLAQRDSLKRGSKSPSSPTRTPPVSGAKRKSSPSPTKATGDKRASDVGGVSYSTPRAAMIKTKVPRSLVTEPRSPDRALLSDSSGGSSPYHTARSMLSSFSGGSASPIGRSAKRFAGGTPYRPRRSSSYDSPTGSSGKKTSPRKSDQEGTSELNDTFTKETESPVGTPKKGPGRPKKSLQPPSSCLRKGTSSSRIKKSVSFTVPGRRSVTPKRLPKTPRRSRTLQESLKDWLSSRGYSLSALRQSSRDNTPVQDKPAKPRRSTGTAMRKVLQSAENQEARASPQKPGRHSLLQESTGDKAGPSKHAKISALLADLRESLEEPDPPEDIEDWLNQLEEQVPGVTEHSAFWMCRCLSFEKAGNLTEAVKSLTAGLDCVTSGREELAGVLQSLLKKAAAAKGEANLSPSMSKKRGRKPSTGPRKRQKSLEVVSTENMFASTIIDYKVYEKPSAKRQSAVLPGKRSLGIAVMTPVRRSSRHSTHSTSPVASQKLLYKSNSALVDE